MNNNIVTLSEYLKNLFNDVHKGMIDKGFTANTLPKEFPICKSTYYNWKKGSGVKTCTILKVCEYFDWPEPKLFL